MVVPLDSPQPTFAIPDLDAVPDTVQDQPIHGSPLGSVGSLHLPPIIFGAGPLSNMYNGDDLLNSDVPLRTVRLALRYGIDAFDTSTYYGPSEIILGQVLQKLASEHPRHTYKLFTKCGRYGSKRSDFDYAPHTLRRSIQRSLQRLGTTYLDVVFLHDVEFVADGHVLDSVDEKLLRDQRKALEDPEAGKAWGLSGGPKKGPGDQQILDAIAELRQMKEEGIIKSIGISGYPLPTLLRLSLLAKNTFGEPLDIVLSYSHYTLQSNIFKDFAPRFSAEAGIRQLLTASPFSMGLLTSNPPHWHPVIKQLGGVMDQVISAASQWPGGLPNLALGYSMRRLELPSDIPTVVGFSTPNEVHECVVVWRELQSEPQSGSRVKQEALVRLKFREHGWEDRAWMSPPAE